VLDPGDVSCATRVEKEKKGEEKKRTRKNRFPSDYGGGTSLANRRLFARRKKGGEEETPRLWRLYLDSTICRGRKREKEKKAAGTFYVITFLKEEKRTVFSIFLSRLRRGVKRKRRKSVRRPCLLCSPSSSLVGERRGGNRLHFFSGAVVVVFSLSLFPLPVLGEMGSARTYAVIFPCCPPK